MDPLVGENGIFKWIPFLQKFKLKICYQHLDEFDLYTNENLIEYIFGWEDCVGYFFVVYIICVEMAEPEFLVILRE